MIISGNREAVIKGVQLIDIHGTRFYDLIYLHEGEDQPRQARVGIESAYEQPQAGDRVRIAYLMNVVTTVTRL